MLFVTPGVIPELELLRENAPRGVYYTQACHAPKSMTMLVSAVVLRTAWYVRGRQG